MVNNQTEFNNKYSKEIKEIKIETEDFEEQQLVIEDYSNLERLYLHDFQDTEKIFLKNLPNLQEITIWDCGLQNLTIKNCPNIKTLNLRSNQLTNLEFTKNLLNLEKIEVDFNPDVNIDLELLPISLDAFTFQGTELFKLLDLCQEDWKEYKEISELANQNNSQELVKKYWNLKKEKKELKNSVKNTLAQILKHNKSLTTQEVLNQFSQNEATSEIVTDLNQESNSLIEENKWQKNQFDQQAPTFEKKLGAGAFGEVWVGIWKTQLVAIKRALNLDENMKEELKLLRDLKSKYIIQYYGEYQRDKEWLIIMEYAEHGSLANFIEKNKNNPHNWPLNYNFIRQMVKGLRYLHAERVLHRDLKSHNVLITEGNIAKLADFGISQIINKKIEGQRKAAGTTRWMAPELLIHDQSNSCVSDIYSLGMIFWEITAKCTVPFKNTEEIFVANNYCRGEREEIPSETPAVLKEIIQGCWKEIAREDAEGKVCLVETRIVLSEIEKKITTEINQENKLKSQVEILPKQ